ncbi:hypothetical protein P148_SR1C00001G0735 [candidate division SR1 bacterium RAAC1_SR1_1]|nr:hypothetical protein P148_SR1C00001G0735 [candidate division SR1 bacterium RAAC1_SR1_1]
MKKNLILFLFVFLIGAGFVVQGQYYYFDTGGTSYPYQQGCSETLLLRINTEGSAARAGRFHLLLDPLSFSYSTSDDVPTLRTNLFSASTTTFLDWSSETSPSWKAGSNKTILQIDRKNNLTDYNGSNGLYGTIVFSPLYNVSTYQGSFGMEYISGSSTTETTLSAVGGVEIIDPVSQNSYRTGTYPVLQQPCVADTTGPLLSVTVPTIGNKKSHLDGAIFSLTDNSGVSGISNVPYVWSGGQWTGNVGGIITNQYGVDTTTLTLTISGNGTGKTYTQSNVVFSTGPEMTWQGNARNFNVNINPGDLFDRGVEKTITITGSLRDRANNLYTLSAYTFNQAQAPILISNSQSPVSNAVFVNLSDPVKLGIQDEWAGVDSGSIVVTLSGVFGTTYGPFQFSGSDLNLSGVTGIANQPDWYINITNHIDFPTSGTIRVSIYAEDMEGTVDTISDYIFSTRPDCSEFQCCNPILLQTGATATPFYYINGSLQILGGINPYFTGDLTNTTGTLYCGTENEGFLLYSGHGNTSGTATKLAFSDSSSLEFSGTNIIAYLTGDNGDTLLLVKLGNFSILVRPGSRPGENFSNLGEIRVYDENKQFIIGSPIETSSTGYADWLDNIPSGTYYIVYKGQSHLASYLSGITIVQGVPQTLDFTTGTVLHNTQNKSLTQDDGFQYQVAGDLENILGQYDFMINGNDIAILTASGFIDSAIAVLDPKNLNGDGAINVSDISVIGINFELTDPYFSSNIFVW